jgi:ABC-type antimicrobial peptide transport system permease subunit
MPQAIRRAMLEADKGIGIFENPSMEETVRETLMPQRMGAWLGGILGLLTVLMAAGGLYGVVAHSVAQRTRELGIRMALGARRADVLRAVVGQGLKLAAVGIALGLPASIWAGFLARHWLSVQGTQLFDLSPADPLALLASSLAIAAVALLAGVIPAWRAATINPVQALRCE